MKWILLGCSLLLAGCETAELTAGGGGATLRPMGEVPLGCQMLGTLREAEGGGLHTLSYNRSVAVTRLRNQAARIGGDSLAVIDEQRGDTDEGHLLFQSGVNGLTTPGSRCTNCISVAAHVYQCSAHPRPAAPPPTDDCTPSGQPDDEDWNACVRKRNQRRTSASAR